MEHFIPIVKYTLLVMTAPIWWPFLKALWEELRDALADDGGIFGSPPGPSEVERLRKERAERGDPLVHDPKFQPRGRRRERWTGQTSASGRASGPPARRKPGFRS